MQFVAAVFSAAALLTLPAVAAAQAATPQAPAAPQTQPAGGQTPPAAPSTAPATAAPQGAPAGAAAPAAAPVTRTFTAPVGLLFNTVRTERVADFEKVLGYLKAALQKSTDPNVQAQARGWRIFKATEPGPNTTVLYVFEFDPTVPDADYGLGRILADAYPEPALLQEIWRLYTTSVTSGGSLLNLTPVEPADPSLTAPGTPTAAPPTSEPRPVPPNSNPVQRP